MILHANCSGLSMHVQHHTNRWRHACILMAYICCHVWLCMHACRDQCVCNATCMDVHCGLYMDYDNGIVPKHQVHHYLGKYTILITPPPPRPCLLPSMAPRLLTHLSPPPQQRHPPLGTPQLSLPARPQQQPFSLWPMPLLRPARPWSP